MKKPKYNFYTCPPDKCISVKLVEGYESAKEEDNFKPDVVCVKNKCKGWTINWLKK